MKQFNMHVLRGHLVIECGDKLCLIDTGSPYSFAFGEEAIVLDEDLVLPSFQEMSPLATEPIGRCNNGAIQQIAQRLTGSRIDGFVGMDLIAQKGLSLDYEQGVAYFGVEEGVKTNLDFAHLPIDYSDYISTKAFAVNGRPLNKVIIDSGAWMSYAGPSLASRLAETDETYEDENPSYGHLTGNLLEGSFAINLPAIEGVSQREIPAKTLRVGKLPQIPYGVEAVIGTNVLSETFLALDLPNKTIHFKA